MNVFVSSGELPKHDGWIEFRFDLFSHIDFAEIKHLMEGRDVIFTCRKRSQGGEFRGSEKERLDLLKKLSKLKPNLIDLECDTDPAFARSLSCPILCSYHNFEKTPDLESIPLFEADHYKIATQANSILDSLRMLSFVRGRENTTGICMGELGQVTRLIGPVVGSEFNYLSDQVATAPGQLTIDEVRNINRETKVYAVIGHPLQHSPGEIGHNALFNALGMNATYVKLPVREDEVHEIFPLLESLPFAGLSVTTPLKEAVMPGCVINTLNRVDNHWLGYSVDGAGALNALKAHGALAEKTIAIIGCGGAAQSIIEELKKRGIRHLVFNRTEEKVRALGYLVGKPGDDYDILINATTCRTDLPVPESLLLPGKIAMEINMQEELTAFHQAALKKGCTLIKGEEMWIHQAALQQEIWGNQSSAEEMIRHLSMGISAPTT